MCWCSLAAFNKTPGTRTAVFNMLLQKTNYQHDLLMYFYVYGNEYCANGLLISFTISVNYRKKHYYLMVNWKYGIAATCSLLLVINTEEKLFLKNTMWKQIWKDHDRQQLKNTICTLYKKTLRKQFKNVGLLSSRNSIESKQHFISEGLRI